MKSDRQPWARSFTEAHALPPSLPSPHRPLSPAHGTATPGTGDSAPRRPFEGGGPGPGSGQAALPRRAPQGETTRALRGGPSPRPQPLEAPVSTALDTSPTTEPHLPAPPR